MRRNWIAVVSAEYVARGRTAGIMQVCHGKAAPLRRVKPGDRVVCYSPTGKFRGTDRLQAFTAIGIVKPGEPYQVDMGGGFCPFRRDVAWLESEAAPIRDLLDRLELTVGVKSWGRKFRFGLLTVSDRDFELIATAMAVRLAQAA